MALDYKAVVEAFGEGLAGALAGVDMDSPDHPPPTGGDYVAEAFWKGWEFGLNIATHDPGAVADLITDTMAVNVMPPKGTA